MEKLKAGEVYRLDIFEMPANLLTRTRMTPEMLEPETNWIAS